MECPLITDAKTINFDLTAPLMDLDSKTFLYYLIGQKHEIHKATRDSHAAWCDALIDTDFG